MDPLTPLLAVNVLDARSLIETFGTLGVVAIIFAETGLLIGVFLPGDSLLFTAGVFCAQTIGGVHLSLPGVLGGTAVAAILGGQAGYLIGRKAGPALLDRPDSRFFKRAWAHRVELHFHRYGEGKALLLARFVPVVRTFINPFAGVMHVPARVFAVWNAVGGALWAVLVTMLGYALGTSLPHGKSIDTYILPVIAAILVISVLPIAVELVRHRRAAHRPAPPVEPERETEDTSAR